MSRSTVTAGLADFAGRWTEAMESIVRILVRSVSTVGILLFVFLMFKVPVAGAYKLTVGTFAVFKGLVVLVAVVLGFKYNATRARL